MVFTGWLPMMAALGSGSRPSTSRTWGQGIVDLFPDAIPPPLAEVPPDSAKAGNRGAVSARSTHCAGRIRGYFAINPLW